MRYKFKTFWHSAPRKNSTNGDGSFIYTVTYQMDDQENNSVVTDTAEINVPGETTNSNTDPYIMSNIMMRVNAMWNKSM